MKVKRYNPELAVEDCGPLMVEQPEGGWVSYESYKELMDDYDALMEEYQYALRSVIY